MRVRLFNNPFNTDHTDRELNGRYTVAALLELLGCDGANCVVYDGESVVRDYDHMLEQDCVTVRIVPAGLETIIVLTIAALAIALPVGFALYDAFTRQPSMDKVQTSPSLRGSSNTARQGQRLPIVLGRHRVYPDLAAQPYSSYANDNQYLHQLFCFGYRDVVVDTTSLKIGETPLSKYAGAVHEINPDPGTVYPLRVLETYVGVRLEYDGTAVPVERTTASGTYRVDVGIAAPNGCYRYNKDGDKLAVDIGIRIEWRVPGTAWQVAHNVTRSLNKDKWREMFPVDVSGADDGLYEIRVQRTTAEGDTSKYNDFVYYDVLACHTQGSTGNRYPIKDVDRYSTASLKLQATNQLNGIVDSLNAICTLSTRTYSGTGTGPASWTVQPTRNPSSALLYLLTDPAVNPRPVADSVIVWEEFEAFSTWCDQQGFSCDAYVTGDFTIRQLCDYICQSNLAQLNARADRIGIRIDKAQPYVSQMFTPRNACNFSQTRDFSPLPEALKLKFISAEVGYVEVERTVKKGDDGAIVYDAELSDDDDAQEVTLFGVTSPSHAAMVGATRLKSLHAQRRIYSWESDIEGLLCLPGDVVLLSNDNFLIGLGQGRILTTVVDIDGQAIALYLDEEITMTSSDRYGIRIRHLDGITDIIPVATNVGTSSRIEFLTPHDTVWSQDDLVAFGEFQKEAAKVLVTEISTDENYGCKIKAVDYVESVYENSDIIPPYDPGISIYPEGTIVGQGKQDAVDLPGRPGLPGTTPLTLTLSLSATQFSFNADGAPKEQDDITVSVSQQGIGQAIHLYVNGAEVETEMGRYIIPATKMIGRTYIRVRATCGDEVRENIITKVTDGSDGPTGPTGPQGIPGPAGENGQSLYTWVAYADDASGSGITADPTGKRYVGFAYNKVTASMTLTPSLYTWAKIEGPQGTTGATGATLYTWLKYADTPTSGMSDSPTGKAYIGLAYNKTTATESTSYSDYTWSLIKGDKGDDARLLRLTCDNPVFRLDKDGVPYPDQKSTLRVEKQGDVGTVKWEMPNHIIPDGTVSYEVSPADMGYSPTPLYNQKFIYPFDDTNCWDGYVGTKTLQSNGRVRINGTGGEQYRHVYVYPRIATPINEFVKANAGKLVFIRYKINSGTGITELAALALVLYTTSTGSNHVSLQPLVAKPSTFQKPYAADEDIDCWALYKIPDVWGTYTFTGGVEFRQNMYIANTNGDTLDKYVELYPQYTLMVVGPIEQKYWKNDPSMTDAKRLRWCADYIPVGLQSGEKWTIGGTLKNLLPTPTSADGFIKGNSVTDYSNDGIIVSGTSTAPISSSSNNWIYKLFDNYSEYVQYQNHYVRVNSITSSNGFRCGIGYSGLNSEETSGLSIPRNTVVDTSYCFSFATSGNPSTVTVDMSKGVLVGNLDTSGWRAQLALYGITTLGDIRAFMDAIPFFTDEMPFPRLSSLPVTITAGEYKDGTAISTVQDGQDVKFISLEAETIVFKANGENVITSPDRILVSIGRQHVEGDVIWTTFPPVPLTGTGDTRILTKEAFGSNEQVKITVSAGGLSDTMTIYKVKDGSSATTVILSNEAQLIPSDSSGKVGEGSFLCDVLGYVGAVTVQPDSVAVEDLPVGMTMIQEDIAGGKRLVFSFTEGTLGDSDVGSISVVIVCNGLTFRKAISWAKSMQGVSGESAEPDFLIHASSQELETSSRGVVKETQVFTFTTQMIAMSESATRTFSCIFKMNDGRTMLVTPETAMSGYPPFVGIVFDSIYVTVTINRNAEINGFSINCEVAGSASEARTITISTKQEGSLSPLYLGMVDGGTQSTLDPVPVPPVYEAGTPFFTKEGPYMAGDGFSYQFVYAGQVTYYPYQFDGAVWRKVESGSEQSADLLLSAMASILANGGFVDKQSSVLWAWIGTLVSSKAFIQQLFSKELTILTGGFLQTQGFVSGSSTGWKLTENLAEFGANCVWRGSIDTPLFRSQEGIVVGSTDKQLLQINGTGKDQTGATITFDSVTTEGAMYSRCTVDDTPILNRSIPDNSDDYSNMDITVMNISIGDRSVNRNYAEKQETMDYMILDDVMTPVAGATSFPLSSNTDPSFLNGSRHYFQIPLENYLYTVMLDSADNRFKCYRMDVSAQINAPTTIPKTVVATLPTHVATSSNGQMITCDLHYCEVSRRATYSIYNLDRNNRLEVFMVFYADYPFTSWTMKTFTAVQLNGTFITQTQMPQSGAFWDHNFNKFVTVVNNTSTGFSVKTCGLSDSQWTQYSSYVISNVKLMTYKQLRNGITVGWSLILNPAGGTTNMNLTVVKTRDMSNWITISMVTFMHNVLLQTFDVFLIKNANRTTDMMLFATSKYIYYSKDMENWYSYNMLDALSIPDMMSYRAAVTILTGTNSSLFANVRMYKDDETIVTKNVMAFSVDGLSWYTTYTYTGDSSNTWIVTDTMLAFDYSSIVTDTSNIIQYHIKPYLRAATTIGGESQYKLFVNGPLYHEMPFRMDPKVSGLGLLNIKYVMSFRNDILEKTDDYGYNHRLMNRDGVQYLIITDEANLDYTSELSVSLPGGAAMLLVENGVWKAISKVCTEYIITTSWAKVSRRLGNNEYTYSSLVRLTPDAKKMLEIKCTNIHSSNSYKRGFVKGATTAMGTYMNTAFWDFLEMKANLGMNNFNIFDLGTLYTDIARIRESYFEIAVTQNAILVNMAAVEGSIQKLMEDMDLNQKNLTNGGTITARTFNATG